MLQLEEAGPCVATGALDGGAPSRVTRASHTGGCIAGARLGEGWWSMHAGVGVRGSLRAPEDKALPDPSAP